MFASTLGRLNVCGVKGVSCVIGSRGFSNTGNSGSNKDTLLIAICKLASALCAARKGFASPIFAAFSANACCISGDIFIGLNKLNKTPEQIEQEENEKYLNELKGKL